MNLQDFQHAIDWLTSQRATKHRHDLSRIQAAMELLEHPERDLPIIHITGTNGKGSTLAFIRDVLIAHGYRVASFTSPHIHRINERLQINHMSIEDELLYDLILRAKEINHQLQQSPVGGMGFFELMTVIASLYFKELAPDVCLVEVGIGGTLDNTNIFDGQIAVITSIGLDHPERLGKTLDSVATNKFGIIKDHATVVCSPMPNDTVQRLLMATVSEKQANLYQLGHAFDVASIRIDPQYRTHFTFESPWLSTDLTMSMIGAHQVANASLAIATSYQWLRAQGKSLDVDASQQAIENTQWPGRMEKVSQSPLVYIDGAHNLPGLEALADVCRTYFKDRKISLLYAGLTTKDQEKQLALLAKGPYEKIYVTEFKHAEATALEQFHSLNHKLAIASLHFVEDYPQFLNDYLTTSHPDELLLVSGSLYFISSVREWFLQNTNNQSNNL